MGTVHPFPSRAVVFTRAELEQVLACCQPRLAALEEMAAAMVQTCPPGDSSWADAADQRDAMSAAMQKLHNACREQEATLPRCQP